MSHSTIASKPKLISGFSFRKLFFSGNIIAIFFCICIIPTHAQMQTHLPDAATYSVAGCLACPGMDWSDAPNITAKDNVMATTTLYHNSTMGIYSYSRALMGSDFGFSIPASAIITGIRVKIKHHASLVQALKDSTVQLMKQNLPVGMNKKKPGNWQTTANSAMYGSSTDLWGTTWTPAEINSIGFGVWMKVFNHSGSDNVVGSVDFYSVTVYYAPMSGKAESQTAIYFPSRRILNITPNPTSSQTTIQFQTSEMGTVNISLFNVSGERVLTMVESFGGGEFMKVIDLSSLPAGNYFVRCMVNGKNWSGEVVNQ